MPDIDTLIVGAGLAGAAAAFSLSRTQRVTLIDAETPASGASGIAAGMVNPISGLRAKPVWRMEEAMEGLERMIDAVGAGAGYDRRGVLRPAKDEEQAGFFKESAERLPEDTTWLEPEAVKALHPIATAPFGALHVHAGGVVDARRFIEALLAGGVAQGLTVVNRARLVGWKPIRNGVSVEISYPAEGRRSTIEAGRLVLALGAGISGFDALSKLDLHAIKGQVVRLIRPPAPPGLLLPLSGYGYAIDEGSTMLIGSSYEHTFSDLAPSPAVSRKLVREATRLIPRLSHCRIMEAATGIRVTVPGTRLPMVGPLAGQERVWIVSGLGSKGLLMAPMIGWNLPDYFAAPSDIPREIQIRVKTG
ncbi:MAG: FAD-dependent oxidoreductase [Rhodothermales bacterium]